MELFQELLFTISFSLIVSLLIVKLIAAASSCDDGGSKESIRVEQKTDKEWVVCDSDEHDQDPVKLTEEVDFRCVEGELVSGVVIKDDESVGGVGACQVFDESPERNEVDDGGVESVDGDEGNVVEGIDGEDDGFDDDDWQGIEATELEKRFGAAVAFVDSKSGGDRVGNEVKIELYGLHRVAIEGSCFEPQPMALKVSARANWNSWKRLENLGREDAMEQYVALLSQHIPNWMGRHTSGEQ